MWGHRRMALALLAALLASLPVWSVAADQTADPTGSDTSAPTLICNGRPLDAGVDLYACRVLGAAADESSFVLRASLPADDPSLPQTVDPFCTGDLDRGSGLCTQTIAAARLEIDGTLLPSGRPLAAVSVIRGGFLRPPGLLPPSAQ